MIVKNKFGRLLSDIQSWKEGFIEVATNKEHWKDGYSAYSLADFMLYQKGENWLKEHVKSLINVTKVEFDYAEIEHASSFDSYNGSRKQDLAIWGRTEKGTIYIAIEAKVLESFDVTIEEAYNHAKEYLRKTNPRSKKVVRIEELVSHFYPSCTPDCAEISNLRYQLFHYVWSSLNEGENFSESKKSFKNRKHADFVFTPVLSFKTSHSLEDDPQGIIQNENKMDFIRFCSGPKYQAVREKTYSFTEGNQTLISSYNEISLL